MPLGIFGSSGKDSGPKPQPLTSSEEKSQSKKEKGGGGASNNISNETKDLKGTAVKLNKKTYTIERKLAEGGFAIVYLVTDKQNRNYALKRQLIRDDPRQVEACRTESQIVKNLNGHKNIVAYVDHQLSMNKAGIYDYMLLTVYYPANVLQLMNSKLLLNKWLGSREILDIFCDVCEAVARLHHSKTPVIHRDLKVENVLIDQRTGTQKPIYILCDFGSSTTKVLSKEHFTHAFMEEEVQRYTTLSYRAPEMIDLYSGVPIDTKSDIWAMGILLYKLCYFSLPFGESALAIQSGLFTFPEAPSIPDEIKAIINLLLTLNARHRPNIYQTAHLAFSAADLKCPVYNIEKSPRIELGEAVQILKMRNKLGSDYARLYEKAFNDFEAQKRRHTAPSVGRNDTHTNDGTDYTDKATATKHETKELPPSHQCLASSTSTISTPVEGVIVSTASAELHCRSMTTSVNPRLRPKPQPIPPNTPKAAKTTPSQHQMNNYITNEGLASQTSPSTSTEKPVQNANTPKDSLLYTSAFRPYTLSHEQKENVVNDVGGERQNAPVFESSNPFIQPSTSSDPNMDDNLFGECFDEMRRELSSVAEKERREHYLPPTQHEVQMNMNSDLNERTQIDQNQVELDWYSIEQSIGDDPFGNAPALTPHQIHKQN